MVSINAIIYNVHWEQLPAKYQRYIKLMLTLAQYTREMSGYGLVTCSLETFQKVFQRHLHRKEFFRL